MTDRERERAFIVARNAQMKARTALLVETREEILAQLRAARDRVTALLNYMPTDYQQWSLTNLQREITRAMAEVAEQSSATLSTAAGKAWEAGQRMVDAPLAAGGVRVAAQLPVIAIDQLIAMRAFMTDRIRDVSASAVGKINSELGLVVIGAQSPFEAGKAVQEILGETSRARATTIVRTELSRVYSAASFERMKQASARIPGMQKEWRKSGKLHPRPGHEAANGDKVPVYDAFNIRSKHGELIAMQYPHDPSAPPAETINCGCIVLPRPPAFTARMTEAVKDQPRDWRGRWTSISRIATEARADDALNRTHDMGVVSMSNAKAVDQFGLRIDGYRRIAEDKYLRHVFKSHGGADYEAARKQRAVMPADFLHLESITSKPDSVSLSPKKNRGSPVLLYVKQIGADEFHYTEAVLSNHRVTMLTFRIRPIK